MPMDLKLYATCFVSIIVIDFVWIGLVMKNFYVEQLKPIGRISAEGFSPVLWSAIAVYIVLSIAIVHFALPKISQDASWAYTFGTGAVLGFVIYGTYDFTNHATLKDWTLAMTFVDIAWGSLLCGVVTLIAKFVRGL
ncbi:MAG: DUF2177 family protein [Bdellovibrionaceae bacterium]|nr:DUF2177 family protein [Pseudobdellovibrionaceae bacterium]